MFKSLVQKIIVLKLQIVFTVLLMLLAYFAVSTYVVEAPVIESDTTDFSNGTAIYERYSARVDRVDVVFEQRDYMRYRLTTNGLVREGELNTERGFGDDIDATVYVLNWQQPEGEQMRYVRLTSQPGILYLLDSNQEIVWGSALTLSPETSE